jgi:hypothetical protein
MGPPPFSCARIASRRAIRSSVGGWVENRFPKPPLPLSADIGFMMNMWASAGLTLLGGGTRLVVCSSLRSALASASGSFER